MKHAYYMTNELKEIEAMHDELVGEGISEDQMHILSDEEATLEKHNLNPVNPFMRTDLLHSMRIGLIVGVVAAFAVVSIPVVFDFSTPIGNLPFYFGAVLVLGFATWEGGLWGIQEANHKYAEVEKEIHQGKHLLIVDYERKQMKSLRRAQQHYSNVEPMHLS